MTKWTECECFCHRADGCHSCASCEAHHKRYKREPVGTMNPESKGLERGWTDMGEPPRTRVESTDVSAYTDSSPHTHGGTDAPECTTCRPFPTYTTEYGPKHRHLDDGCEYELCESNSEATYTIGRKFYHELTERMIEWKARAMVAEKALINAKKTIKELDPPTVLGDLADFDEVMRLRMDLDNAKSTLQAWHHASQKALLDASHEIALLMVSATLADAEIIDLKARALAAEEALGNALATVDELEEMTVQPMLEIKTVPTEPFTEPVRHPDSIICNYNFCMAPGCCLARREKLERLYPTLFRPRG